MRVIALSLSVSMALSATSAVAGNIRIQPIQVCTDDGSSCANVNTFSSYTNKIYAQRGDTVEFLSLKQLNSSKYFAISGSAEADELIGSTIFGGTERSLFAYDMWFVSEIGGGLAGRGALGGDGIVINDDIITLNRFDTIAHELGHNLGFSHSSETQTDAERFLMAPGGIREIPKSLGDIAPDGRQLDRFDPILPMISVDTIGSTPFASTGFFNVKFLAGSASDVSLSQITINLAPAGAFTDPTNSPPGLSGSPFGFSNLNGISAGDISVSGVSDGSQFITLDIAPGTFVPGESFDFGVDIDLFSRIDAFGATPDELRNVAIGFSFSNGYTFNSSLDDLIASTAFDPTANYDKLARVFADPEPLTGIGAVPEPASWALMIAGFGLVGASLRRRRPSLA